MITQLKKKVLNGGQITREEAILLVMRWIRKLYTGPQAKSE